MNVGVVHMKMTGIKWQEAFYGSERLLETVAFLPFLARTRAVKSAWSSERAYFPKSYQLWLKRKTVKGKSPTAWGLENQGLGEFAPWKESYDQHKQHIKEQRHCFANKGPSSQGNGFSNSHVWMWELDYKESWVPKNWCFWTVVLEKTLESPSDCKEIQPVHPKGNQSWIFIGRTDAKAETPILWPPNGKSWLTGKDPDAGKDWRREKKGMTDDEMVGWHQWLKGHEFE